MKRFAVGQRVVIVRSEYPERIGEVTTVTTELHEAVCVGAPDEWPPGTLVYTLATQSVYAGHHVAYPPAYLEPYVPDDREPVAWSEDLIRLVGNGLFPARKEPVR